jgi:long-subunit acyl-CoA synthetase (AMP-forming)
LDPDRTALVWEKDEPGQEERMSYAQLLDLVGRLANLLRQVHEKMRIRNKILNVKYSYHCQSSKVQKFIRPKFLRN